MNIDDSNGITTTSYETTSMRVDSFIENHQIDYVYGQDVIDVELYSVVSDDMEINIQKAVQIPVTADGQTQTITTLPVTVGELLKELDIKVGENDIVEPAQDHLLQKGDELFVRRVTTDVAVEEITTDYQLRYEADYSMSIGKTEVVQEGSAGKVQNTYEVVLIGRRRSFKDFNGDCCPAGKTGQSHRLRNEYLIRDTFGTSVQD